jgi:hypothetical protein
MQLPVLADPVKGDHADRIQHAFPLSDRFALPYKQKSYREQILAFGKQD